MIFWFVCLFSFDLLIIMLFYSKQNNNKKEWNLCAQAELHYKENIVGCCFFCLKVPVGNDRTNLPHNPLMYLLGICL